MGKIVLAASKKGERKNDEIRFGGEVPAICYGAGKDNVAVVVKHNEFVKVYREAGENSVVELEIDGGKENVLIYEMQLHPLNGSVEHIDFKFVDMNKPVIAPIPLEFVGTSPAVKELAGILNKTLTEVEVEALPADLPHEIKVDISVLEDFNSVLHVSDIDLSDKVTMITEPGLTIATVTAPREEEPEEELLSPEEMEKQAMEAAVGAEEGEDEEKSESKDSE